MTLKQIQMLEQKADNLRFIFDQLLLMTDENNTDEERLDCTESLAVCSHLHDTITNAREIFRDLANYRTDMGTFHYEGDDNGI